GGSDSQDRGEPSCIGRMPNVWTSVPVRPNAQRLVETRFAELNRTPMKYALRNLRLEFESLRLAAGTLFVVVRRRRMLGRNVRRRTMMLMATRLLRRDFRLHLALRVAPARGKTARAALRVNKEHKGKKQSDGLHESQANGTPPS